jgi:hypothetical protein
MTILGLFFLLSFTLSTAHAASASTQSQSWQSGLLIPLYAPPGSAWNTLIQAKESYPSVPIIAIVNPDNGPGTSVNPTYATWIDDLKAAGIVVVGYVYTDYASRSLTSVETDVSNYESLYGVNGVFLDQMSNKPGYQSYYSTISSYAYSLGMSLTVGNPGDPVPPSYVGTVNIIVVYESPGTPSISTVAADSMGMNKSNFAIMSYDVPSPSPAYVEAALGYVNYIYLASGVFPSPYATLPNYFSYLVAEVADAVPSMDLAAIHVQALALSGAPLTGMWTVVKASDGAVVASGFTPFVYDGVMGNNYTLCMGSYSSYIFSHWENWSTDSCRTLTLSQTEWLVPSYNT